MHRYTFGIEEEYFVVNRRSGRPEPELSDEFMRDARNELGPQLMPEILQSQIEVATHPMLTPADAAGELGAFRPALARVGKKHDRHRGV